MLRPTLLAALTLAAAPALAADFVPGGNAGTLARPFALPTLGTGAVLPTGGSEFQATLDFTNEYVSEGQGNCAVECILLDGETARLRLDWRQGFARGWEWSAGVPILRQGGGFLDGWIQDWHGWFGLPNGGREFAADNQYHYQYIRGGTTLMDETMAGNCIGQVDFGLARALGPASALHGMVKVPTHTSQALCGDNLGGAVWYDAARPARGGWGGYFSIGYSMNQPADVAELGDLQQRGVLFGGVGLLLPITDSVRISAQVQGNSHLYKGSTLAPLAKTGAPLTLGLQFRTGPRSSFDIGFQEDPSVSASPDFGAYLAFTAR